MTNDASVDKVNQKIEVQQTKLRKDARMQQIKKNRLQYSLKAKQEDGAMDDGEQELKKLEEMAACVMQIEFAQEQTMDG